MDHINSGHLNSGSIMLTYGKNIKTDEEEIVKI